jgi:leucyl aminopeptidase
MFAILIVRVVLIRPQSFIPGALAEEAAKIASTYSDVFTATILDAEKCKELKMGSYLAVAAASDTNPPYFIHLCYKPPGGNVKTKLALIGKGITFDRFIYTTFDTE